MSERTSELTEIKGVVLCDFIVIGDAVTQGSKSIGASGQMYEQGGKRWRAWRDAIAWGARATYRGEPYGGDVFVQLGFALSKPKRKRDIDKLCRAMLDGVVDGGVIKDDSQVTSLFAFKVTATEMEVAPQASVMVIATQGIALGQHLAEGSSNGR